MVVHRSLPNSAAVSRTIEGPLLSFSDLSVVSVVRCVLQHHRCYHRKKENHHG